jgi:hypothetical protein
LGGHFKVLLDGAAVLKAELEIICAIGVAVIGSALIGLYSNKQIVASANTALEANPNTALEANFLCRAATKG